MSLATNAQQVYADLVGIGLSPGAATGVVGNLVAESDVNPRAVQPGGPGRGIAQWSLGGRWDQLVAWVQSTSGGQMSPWDLNPQEAFMIKEMKTMGVWDQLQQIQDPQTAAALVMRKYEMPADQTDANAAHRAQLGEQAVAGTVQSLLDKAKNAAGNLWGFAQDPAGTLAGAAGSAAGSAVSAVKPLLFEGLFVVLGLGLVVLGVNRAFDIRGRANAARADIAQAVI